MKTPKEILDIKRHSEKNINNVELFLVDYFTGEPIKYEGELTENDIAFMQKNGWAVKKEDNGVDKYGYHSWFLISEKK